jgi:hypothetical protein
MTSVVIPLNTIGIWGVTIRLKPEVHAWLVGHCGWGDEKFWSDGLDDHIASCHHGKTCVINGVSCCSEPWGWQLEDFMKNKDPKATFVFRDSSIATLFKLTWA